MLNVTDVVNTTYRIAIRIFYEEVRYEGFDNYWIGTGRIDGGNIR